MNKLRAIACPDCRDRKDVHHFCERCYGSRIITLVEREPIHLTGKQLWVGFWHILMWVLVALAPLALFARKMGWL